MCCLQSLVLLVLLENFFVGLDLDVCDCDFPLFQHGVVQRVHFNAMLSGHCLYCIHEMLFLRLDGFLQCAFQHLDALVEALLVLS